MSGGHVLEGFVAGRFSIKAYRCFGQWKTVAAQFLYILQMTSHSNIALSADPLNLFSRLRSYIKEWIVVDVSCLAKYHQHLN